MLCLRFTLKIIVSDPIAPTAALHRYHTIKLYRKTYETNTTSTALHIRKWYDSSTAVLEL